MLLRHAAREWKATQVKTTQDKTLQSHVRVANICKTFYVFVECECARARGHARVEWCTRYEVQVCVSGKPAYGQRCPTPRRHLHVSHHPAYACRALPRLNLMESHQLPPLTFLHHTQFPIPSQLLPPSQARPAAAGYHIHCPFSQWPGGSRQT